MGSQKRKIKSVSSSDTTRAMRTVDQTRRFTSSNRLAPSRYPSRIWVAWATAMAYTYATFASMLA